MDGAWGLREGARAQPWCRTHGMPWRVWSTFNRLVLDLFLLQVVCAKQGELQEPNPHRKGAVMKVRMSPGLERGYHGRLRSQCISNGEHVKSCVVGFENVHVLKSHVETRFDKQNKESPGYVVATAPIG